MAAAAVGESVDDRRRAPRYPIRLAVTLVVGGGSHPSVWGHTVDICIRGMRVVTEADPSRDAELSVFLDVGGTDGPLVAGADIVWTEQRGEQWVHGLLLTSISPEDELRLRDLCRPT